MVTELKSEGESPTQTDVFAMILGKTLELYSKHHPQVMVNGEALSPEHALETIDELLGGL
jgi:hypothetical protein